MYQMVLTALMNCDGIKKYTIINSIDPLGNSASQITYLDKHHPIVTKTGVRILSYVAEKPLGCAANTKRAIDMGFSYLRAEYGDQSDDFVIHLEDDIVPSRDFLKYMEFCQEKFYPVKDVHAVIGWNRRTETIDHGQLICEMPFIGTRIPPVTYQAWGIWRDRWEECTDDWFGIHWQKFKPLDDGSNIPEGDDFLDVIRKDDAGSWGWPMKQYWRRGRKEVYPLVSRCQNIGDKNGAFNYSSEWHQECIHNHVVAENTPAPDNYELMVDNE